MPDFFDVTETQAIIACLILVGVWLIAQSIFLIFKQAQVKNWQKTRGIVVASHIKHWKTRVYIIVEHKYYQPKITYRYKVDGIIYESHTLRFGSEITQRTREKAQKILNQFLLTKQPIIYFNPKNPQQSVLIPDAINAGAIGLFLTGGGLIIATSIVGMYWYATCEVFC